MTKTFLARSIASVFALHALAACTPARDDGGDRLNFVKVFNAAGIQGVVSKTTGAIRLQLARTRLKVTVNGTLISPGFGLTAWASFTGTPSHTLLIGEAPLLESEVNGFLDEAISKGLEITALHNAFLWDQPRVMSLHFTASGEEEKVAGAIGSLFRKLNAGDFAAKKPPTPIADTRKTKFDLSNITQYLWQGELIDDSYRISTGRGTEVAGQAVGESMGVGTWATFAGTDAHALVSGDIATLETELHDVLKNLIAAHIGIISIHTHMIEEKPRLVFIHFWGTGPLVDLAKGLRAALYAEKNFRGST